MTKKREITIVTSQALTPTQKKSVASLLEQKIGAVTPTYLVDPTIIGGLKITIDGQELEGSLVGEIKKLRSMLPSVSITTAVELTPSERKEIEKIVTKKVGSADYTITVDQSVLGGIKMVIDNEEYDGTLKGKLQTLQKVLLKKILA